MKKRMLKIFASVFVIVVLCAVFAGCERGGDTSRYAIEKAEFVTTYDVVTMTREISEKYPDRTSGSEAETTQGGGDYDVLAAGGTGGYAQNDYIFLNEYVAPKMSAMGYLGGIEQFRFTDVYDGSKLKDGFNGVWTKAAAGKSKGEIRIVAAYDNSVGITVSNVDLTTGQVSQTELGGEGTYASATSVAAALAIADRLAEAETQYDLTFAFVGCSQFGNAHRQSQPLGRRDVQLHLFRRGRDRLQRRVLCGGERGRRRHVQAGAGQYARGRGDHDRQSAQ